MMKKSTKIKCSKILSILMSFLMVLTMIPSTAIAYSTNEALTLEQTQETEEIINKIEDYFLRLEKGESGKLKIDTSLSAFALKSAGIDLDQFEIATDDSVYSFENRFGTGKNFSYATNKNWAEIAELTDKIFDWLALEKDASTLVEQLISKQNNDGWFDTAKNSAYQAKAIMSIDAYLGKDYDNEWPNYEEGNGKGRIAALKALAGSQYFMGGRENGAYKGSLFIPRQTNAMFGPFNVYNSSAMQVTAVAVTALSNYTDCKSVVEIDGKNVVLGEFISDTAFDIAYEYAESNGLEKGSGSSYASYYIPALISSGDVNKIDEYELIQSLKNAQQENGSYKSNTKQEKLAVNVETQQVLIALGDLLAGQNAYVRIKSPRAETVEKLSLIAESMAVPTDIQADTEGGDDDNYTGKVDLPMPVDEGLTITWKSSNPDVISDDGVVYFPDNKTESVILTAKLNLTYGSESEDIVNKEVYFTVNVQSKIISKMTNILKEQLDDLDIKYVKDISELEFEGIEAIYNSTGNLNEYIVSDLLSEESAGACAKNVIQLILTKKNPYNYNGKNYVEILKSSESEYDGNPFVLASFDALGETPDNILIEDIVSKATTGTSIYCKSLAVNSLAVHFDYSSSVTHTAIVTSPSAITMEDIDDEFTEYASTIQDENGMFGDNQKDHAAVVSTLISLGEDLFTEKYIKNDNNVYDAVRGEEYNITTKLKVLGDIVPQKSLWQKIALTRLDFDILLNTAESIYETGTGKYSASSMQSLKNAIISAQDVKSSESFGEEYFYLKDALNNLSSNMLPEFIDLYNYDEESVSEFKNAAEDFYYFFKTSKNSSIINAKNYADEIAEAYSKLNFKNEKIDASKLLFQQSDTSYKVELNNYSYNTDTLNILENELSPTQKYAEILEKTVNSFDDTIKYDLSNMSYWGVFDVSAMNKDISKYVVYDVTKHKNGMFLTYQATDYAAITLQLILTGENPYNYNGINYVERLQKIGIKNQGVFGAYANNIWALLALDAVGADYDPLLINLVAGQAASETFDLDMRGWALTAVANHRQDPKVEQLIQTALTNIETMQVSEGIHVGYFKHLLYENYNIFTHSCVVSGLVAVGEDLTSSRWTKSGANPLDVIKRYQLEDGRLYDQYDENGVLINPGFNKDAIIALGDVTQGSNVWQRTYLDETKINKAIDMGEEALKNVSEQVPEYKKSALEAALKTAKEIEDIKGNGHKYFSLLEAIKSLDEIELPEFTNKGSYTAESFLQFENAVKSAALILMQSEATASDLNNSCQEILTTYDALKEKRTDPTDPGSNDKITVTFKLLGATKHGGNGTVQTLRYGNLKTWISKTTVEVSKSSKVYDVFTKILDEKGYQYIGAEDNYVSYIITPDGVSLGEYDNGNSSGWMYTVNGKHPNIGLTAYTLEDGDDIVWHYTDDYEIEEGSEKWNSGSSGTATDDSGVKLELSTEKNKSGVVIAELTAKNAKTFAEAIGKLENKNGISAKLEVKLPEEASGLKVTIPESIMKALKDKDSLSLEISSDMWGVTIEAQVLKSIIDQYGTKDLEISFIKTDISSMSEETKALIGERTVYDISLYSKGQYVKSFGGGEITCYIPYDADKEDATKLGVYRIKEDGTHEKIKDCNYDEKGKIFGFSVTSLSNFAVGYNDSTKISFVDIPDGHWAEKYIVSLAEKGIINGKAENIFAPNDSIARAEFVAILARMSNEDLSKYSVSKFDDVNNNDWFSKSIAWASENGIAMGYNGKFDPQEKVDRQDMAVMLIRYMENIEKGELTKENGKTVFNDDSEISDYARDAVYSMAEGDIISGKTNGIFDPTAPATRAEAAKMIDLIMLQINK